MRRGGWRGFLVVILAMAMVWALAPASVAKKPPGTPGGKSPFSVSVDVVGVHPLADPYTWEADAYGYPFYWVNAVGDQMKFVVTVDGPTSGTVSLNGVESFDGSFVDEEFNLVPIELPYVAPDWGSSTGIDVEIEVVADGTTKVVSTTVPVEAFPDCEDEGWLYYSEEDGKHVYKGTPEGWCRWAPVILGTWDVSITPAGEIERPTHISATLRDHVPGNWCALSSSSQAGEFEANSGVVDGRTRGGEITGFFHLPETGICLGGGAGGYTMAVGNTTDFVLATDSHIVITQEVPQPPSEG